MATDMRVCFDSSVLVDSALEPQGPSGRALLEVEWGRLQLITSPSILGEYEGILTGKYHKARVLVTQLRQGLEHFNTTTIVNPSDLPPVVADDPMDDHVIAAAVAGNADMIVSTDHHLRDLKSYKGIPIVSPDEFLVLIGAVKSGLPARDGAIPGPQVNGHPATTRPTQTPTTAVAKPARPTRAHRPVAAKPTVQEAPGVAA